MACLLCVASCSYNNKAEFLPKAVQFRNALRESDVWSEVILYTYEDLNTGKRYKHAVVAFKYPATNPYMRLYDKEGSRRILDLYTDKNVIDQYAMDLALKAEQSKRNYHHSIIEAEIVK